MVSRRFFIAIVLSTFLVAACGSGDASTDLVGNPKDPTLLRLATEETESTVTALLVRQFADEVERVSDGSVRVDISFGAVDGGLAWDQAVIAKAADGEFDLVVARAGAWHTSGVTSLDVLQLPGLIDTDDQADRLIADRSVVDQLLSGLGAVGFTGLGLFPEAPRYLIAVDDRPTDFGVAWRLNRRVRTPLSEPVFDVLSAAGMKPVDLTGADFLTEVANGTLTATEGQLARVELTTTIDGNSDAIVATNLPLYTKFLVLAARSDAIDPDVMTTLLRAANVTMSTFAESRPRQSDGLASACEAGGRLMEMADVDREAFMAAVQPVVQAFADGPDGDLLEAVRASAGPADRTELVCSDPADSVQPSVSTAPPSSTIVEAEEDVGFVLPTKRSDIVPTAGDLADGVYRFSQTVEVLELAEPGEEHTAAAEFIGEFTLVGGNAELRYFNMDGSPMAGEPPSTGGSYQVMGDLMIFATPPNRALPGTSGIYLLRWSLDGDVLTLTQIDDGRVDADFAAPWIRVGDAP